MAKSLEDKLSWVVEGRDSLAVDLARRDLEHEVSERYKGYVVRSRLKSVSNAAMKCNTLAREKEVQRFPFRYIESVKSPDGCMLGLNHEMQDAFQAHFHDCFAHCPNLHSYLAAFGRLKWLAARVWLLNAKSEMC